MAMKFQDVILKEVGRRGKIPPLMFGKLVIQILDETIDQRFDIEIDVRLPDEAERTLGELEEKARQTGIALLREALASLEAHDIRQLREKAATEIDPRYRV